MITYQPESLAVEVRVPDVHSAWKGLECLIPDIVRRFNVDRHIAIDCGVWYGYSTAALANFFDQVIGVDTFKGDRHAGFPSDLWDSARRTMRDYPNVVLVESDCIEYLKTARHGRIGLVHVDVVHDFETTYEVGKWASNVSPVVLFHDTCAFPEVAEAVEALAKETGRTFHNYPQHYGLGILV